MGFRIMCERRDERRRTRWNRLGVSRHGTKPGAVSTYVSHCEAVDHGLVHLSARWNAGESGHEVEAMLTPL